MGQMRGALMFGVGAEHAKLFEKLFDNCGELSGKGRKPAEPRWTEDDALGYVFAVWHDADGKPDAMELNKTVTIGTVTDTRAAQQAREKWKTLRAWAAKNGVDLPAGEVLLCEVETA